MNIRVLIVEDDEFKAADLLRTVEENVVDPLTQRASSVTSALRAISGKKFDLVLLDMSLPTFDLSGPGGGGSPQGQGGVEVLRLARRLKSTSQFVVVTQYPDVELEGKEIALAEAARALSSRFSLRVTACLAYEFDRDSWREPLKKILAGLAPGRISGLRPEGSTR